MKLAKHSSFFILHSSLIIVLQLATSFAIAKDNVLEATCVAGTGCTFKLTSVTGEEMDIVLGLKNVYSSIGNNDILVHAKTKGGWKTYIERKRTRSELDRLYGGDGYTMIYLFDPNIQPKDGHWKGNMGTPQVSPCIVDVGKYISNIRAFQNQGSIRFPKPFRPEFLLNNPAMRWLTVSPNQFKGIMDFGGGASSPMKLVYDAKIVDDKYIEGVIVATISIPSQSPCRVTVPVHYRLIAENPDDDRDIEPDPFEIDDLLEVKPSGKKPEDDLLEVKPSGKKPEDDLLEVKPKGKKPEDDLLEVKPRNQ